MKVSAKLKAIQKEVRAMEDEERGQLALRFFKSGKNEYGAGDLFLGISVPEVRKLARKHRGVELETVWVLLASKWHEERHLALIILCWKFSKGSNEVRKEILDGYLERISRFINNWDLVDVSARDIVGEWVGDWAEAQIRGFLEPLLRSSNLWERRVGVVSCFALIKRRKFRVCLWTAEMVIRDKEDLIHKAAGWMVRELGKIDVDELRGFLDKFADIMPRTMLRYSLEKFSAEERAKYMAKGKK